MLIYSFVLVTLIGVSVPAGADHTIGRTLVDNRAIQVPDAQYVVFLFALAQVSSNAEVVAAACGQFLDVKAELREVRGYKKEARQKISELPRMTGGKISQYFRVNQESQNISNALRSGEMDCSHIVRSTLSTLRNVRQLVLDREQRVKNNAD